MAGTKEVRRVVSEMLDGFLADNDMELYHVDFAKEGRDWYLKVYIDRIQNDPDGNELYISSDDCELVSKYLSDRLDEKDPIEQNYMLMVSSPGMDRRLYTQAHYDRYVGSLVEVKLYKAVDGQKEFEGTLLSKTDDGISIRTEDGKEYLFPEKEVVKTNLAVVF